MLGRRFLSDNAKASPNGIEKVPIDHNDIAKESFRRTPICYYCKTPGHKVEDCTLTPCKRCNRKGHSSDVCQTKQCDECGRFGHSSESCWHCEKCGKYGHQTETCRTEMCGECLKMGHSTERCFQKLLCTKCGKNGHITGNCRTNINLPLDTPQNIREDVSRFLKKMGAKPVFRGQCSLCGETTHSSRDCNNEYIYRR